MLTCGGDHTPHGTRRAEAALLVFHNWSSLDHSFLSKQSFGASRACTRGQRPAFGTGTRGEAGQAFIARWLAGAAPLLVSGGPQPSPPLGGLELEGWEGDSSPHGSLSQALVMLGGSGRASAGPPVGPAGEAVS